MKRKRQEDGGGRVVKVIKSEHRETRQKCDICMGKFESKPALDYHLRTRLGKTGAILSTIIKWNNE